MKHLIDKDALVAEIERLRMNYGRVFNEYDTGFSEGRSSAFDEVLSFLDTLEVKEKDLEKEIKLWFDYGLPNNDELLDYIKETAKHFFELGLKAKGE